MKRKPRRKVEPGMDDPLSQEISALQMKIADLRVDYTRAHAALERLINQRKVETLWREILQEAIPAMGDQS